MKSQAEVIIVKAIKTKSVENMEIPFSYRYQPRENKTTHCSAARCTETETEPLTISTIFDKAQGVHVAHTYAVIYAMITFVGV